MKRRPAPDVDRWCGSCMHERAVHRRGWGPCTHETRTTKLHTDGSTAWSGIVACDCRRFAISTFTEAPQ